jgi:8-oxo-dGTP pyrophosphatase MutT (NUDIX family)
VLSTREVYKNPWIRLREDQVTRPDGNRGIYGVIECRAAVGVVAVTEDEQVYLVGQYRYPTQRYSWEVVSGFCEPGETTLEGARRELREEAGLEASDWTYLGDYDISNSVTDQVGHIFLARGLTECGADPEPTEEFTLRLLPLADAVREAQCSAIVQTYSVASLFRAWHHLRGDLA